MMNFFESTQTPGVTPDFYEKSIHSIIKKYHKKILENTENTQSHMDSFENSHHKIYKLFYNSEQIEIMEREHNRARILSANTGRIFDEAIKFIITNVEGGKSEYIDNTKGHPKKFEIDIMNHYKKVAYEIKWRDAGTDGDHKAKEYRKVDIIKGMGYTPIRLTFFLPELPRSLKAQQDIINYYENCGQAYTGEDAFNFVNKMAKINLWSIFSKYEFL